MGALRRAAPIPSARPLSKRSRGVAPVACGATARASSARRGGADQKSLSAPGPKYIKVNRNGIVVEMEVLPVGGREVSHNGCSPFMKRPQIVETASRSTMSRKKPARRAGADEKLSVPSPKRTKVTRNNGVETSVEPALGTLRKRMAVELDNLHALLSKAEVLSSRKNGRLVAAKPRSGAPVEASIKTPPEKRKKVSALAKIAEFKNTEEDENEFVDICGGVSPVAILKTSPVVCVGKAGETGDSPSSTGSSSSDSDSDSDSDETASEAVHARVNIPVARAVLPKKNGTSVQPSPEPETEVTQKTEQEELKGKKRAAPAAISKATLIAKAKVRRTLMEMERSVRPDESIHLRDLKDLCIPEYGCPSTMRQLGLFLKADA